MLTDLNGDEAKKKNQNDQLEKNYIFNSLNSQILANNF
jgi:hypothetical protein